MRRLYMASQLRERMLSTSHIFKENAMSCHLLSNGYFVLALQKGG